MSKSYNNTIDPVDVSQHLSYTHPSSSTALTFLFVLQILDKYSVDTMRYYSVMATTYGSDLNFSEASLVLMHNAELADTLGNLVHRGINLCLKFCDGVIPNVEHDPAFPMPFDFDQLEREIREDMTHCAINSATFRAMEAVRATNRYLTTAEPWKMKSEADIPRRAAIVRTTLEAIYLFTHYLAAVIPHAADAIFTRLGTPPRPTFSLNGDFYNLTPGTAVFLGDILFSKIEEGGAPAGTAAAAADGGKVSEGGKKSGGGGKVKVKGGGDEKKEKPAKEKKPKEAAAAAPPPPEEDQHDFTKIELRVGKIVRVWNHESAERCVHCVF
jgi:methionyl-tRNA synthetase